MSISSRRHGRGVWLAPFLALGCLLPAPIATAQNASAGAAATREMLGLRPDSALFSVALPACGRMERRLLRVAERFAGGMADVRALWNAQVHSLAASLGAPEAGSLAELLSQLGIEPDAPMGLFVDPAPAVDGAKDALALAALPAPWLHKGTMAQETPLPELERFHGVVVAHCRDAETAARQLQRIVTLLAAQTLSETRADGRTLWQCGIFLCCIQEGLLFLANDSTMLMAILDKLEHPAPVRYGTPECPATLPDELVLLTRMDTAWSLLPGALPFPALYGDDPSGMPTVLATIGMQPAGLFDSEDPCVTTLGCSDSRVEWSARVDLTRQVKYAAWAGRPDPPEILAALPGDAAGFAVSGYNASVRNALESNIFGIYCKYSAQPLLALFDHLGGCAVAMTPTTDGLPRVTAVLKTSQPQDIEALAAGLGTVSGIPSSAEDRSLRLQAIAAEGQGTWFTASGPDFVAASNGQEEALLAARRMLSGEATSLPESLPAASPRNSPTFGVVFIKADALPTLLGLAGSALQLPEAAKQALALAARPLQRISAGEVVDGDWQKSFVSIELN